MDFVITFLKEPVTIGVLSGLALGLIITLVILIKTRIFKNELEQEIRDTRYEYRRLEDQLNTQMRVSSRKQDELTAEIEQYRATVQANEEKLKTANQKPGRRELRKLELYQRAEQIMAEQSPGSTLAWENAMKSAEAELKEAEKGFKPMMRKVFGGDDKHGDH